MVWLLNSRARSFTTIGDSFRGRRGAIDLNVAVVPASFRGIEPHPLLPIKITVKPLELPLGHVLTQNNNFQSVS
jgi:hypothetical protein